MQKIILITIYDISVSGGLSTYTKNLYNLYKDNNIDVSIVSPITKKISFYTFVILCIKVIFIFNTFWGLKLYYSFTCYWIFRSISNNATKDKSIIFHFQDVVSLTYIYKKIKSKNIILTVHGDLTNMNLSDKIIRGNHKAENYSKKIEYTGYYNAKKIIAVDERLLEHVRGFDIKSHKIKKIPNFTDLSKFSIVSTAKRRSLRIEKGLKLDANIIFCPRRLVHKNGVLYAIKVIEKLNKDFILIITGEGAEKKNILEYIRLKNLASKIIVTGDLNHDEMKKYYQLSDLTIIPSINSSGVIEATSISAIESMACGVPVIASNIGGLKELILDGINGYLVTEKHVENFCFNIEKFISLSKDNKNLMKHKAREAVELQFSGTSYYNQLKGIIYE